MGGVSSRFDQTQWWNADGELLSSIDPSSDKGNHTTILPGVDPTTTLEIFDLLKSKSLTASRDFEIKDSNKKVIYATKAVPGTMAWFDLIKPGASSTPALAEGDEEAAEEAETEDAKEDGKNSEEAPTTTAEDESEKEELLLRVQSDWNRRSWTVYSRSPVFPGQLPASLPIRKGVKEGCELYKSCCITLSWSKAFAVVARYGPPTNLQDILEDGEGAEIVKGYGDYVEESERSITDDLFEKAESIAAKERQKHNVAEDVVKLNQSQSSMTSASAEKTEEEHTGVIDALTRSFKTYAGADPALEHHKTPLSPEEKRRHALEGVVNLDSPLLQCQAILGKKRQYQTRLISKEDTIKLWVLDEAWNKERFLKHEDEDPTQGSTKSPLGKAVSYELSQLEKPHDVEELKLWFSNEYVDEDQRNMVKENAKTSDGRTSLQEKRTSLIEAGKSWFSFRPQKGDGDESVASQEEPSDQTDQGDNAAVEGNNNEAESKDETEESTTTPKVYGSNHGLLVSDDSPDRKEPLVSHWQWKNTYTTHKIQMHLAKNSDLALHVVLSIVFNVW